MSKYQAYPEYKDSGVEWLGDIPSHWEAKPLKFICTYNDEVIADSTRQDVELEYVDIGSVSVLSGISHVETITFGEAPSRARRIVRDGDVIVSTVRTYLEAIASINNPPENMIVSTGFAVIRPNKALYKGYAAYCLRASGFIKEVVARSVGVSYPAINALELVNIKIPNINYQEQTQIASFLDHETAKIDILIQKQQQLIKLLKEKRQAVISHTVTKGLNLDVPIKDSGVEWLGYVPSHWKLTQVKYGYNITLGKMLQKSPKSSVDILKPYLKAQNIQPNGINLSKVDQMWFSPEECKSLLLLPGDVLVSEGGDVGRSVLWNNEIAECYIQNAINRVRTINDNSTKFFNYWITYLKASNYINILCNKATIAHYTAEKLKASLLLLPMVNEQEQIADFLDHETYKIEILIKKQKQVIKLLQERRTSLISAAVTGKIDVRHWQAPVTHQASDRSEYQSHLCRRDFPRASQAGIR
ncbi:restriction endonuclease subunit S [Xenorhabdus sp. Vera]|uniref:restriction endonuclease subunit S n=1 Tax=Xenorhabdus koppenhoeferi TaxID=351659 RepID=UPI0019CDAE79|nr:restriction endonuclease subunit S [Xenorhabdus sp. Vera]MBD2810866.1 restriction endonuclease subunit S [Xenorhabdus sp. Vera]